MKRKTFVLSLLLAGALLAAPAVWAQHGAPKTNHFAWTGEETVVQLNGVGPWGITYVNPADDPRKN